MPKKRIYVKKSKMFEDRYGNIIERKAHMREIEKVKLGKQEKQKIREGKSSRLDETMSDVMERNMDNPEFIIDQYTIDTYWDKLSIEERTDLLERFGYVREDVNEEIGEVMDDIKSLSEAFEAIETGKFEPDDEEQESMHMEMEDAQDRISYLQGKQIDIKKALEQNWYYMPDYMKNEIDIELVSVNKFHKERLKKKKTKSELKLGYQQISKEHFRDEWKSEALSDKVSYLGNYYRSFRTFGSEKQAEQEVRKISERTGANTLILRDGFRYKVFVEE